MSGPLAGLLLAMQGAVGVEDVHADYLDAIGGVVAASAYGFTHFDPDDDGLTPLSVLTRGAPTGLVPAYNALGVRKDPMFVAGLSSGTPTDSSRLMPLEEWQAQDLYRVLSDQGLQHSLVVPLTADSRILGALYLARSADDGAFAVSDLRAMAVVKSHVETALGRSLVHQRLDRHASLLAWALDELDVPVLLGSLEGEIFFQNRALRRLSRAHALPDELMVEMVAVNVRELRAGARRVAVTSEQIAPRHPVQDRNRPAGCRLVMRSAVRRGPGEVVVSFPSVQSGEMSAPVELAPLSAREREIAGWVAEGLTNRQIAEVAFVSENTVRQHLKRIFAKLDVHNRAQLVHAVWRGANREK